MRTTLTYDGAHNAHQTKGTFQNMMNDDEYQQRQGGIVSELSASRPGMRFLDRYFTEPMAFGCSGLPGVAGVYGILVSAPSWQPRPYRPIYFGETGDLAGNVATSHEKYAEWLRVAGTADQLYVAYHLMSSDEAQRAAFAKSLIGEYRPECNEMVNDSPPLAETGSEVRELLE